MRLPRLLIVLPARLWATIAAPTAQAELDGFMKQALERRNDDWKWLPIR